MFRNDQEWVTLIRRSVNLHFRNLIDNAIPLIYPDQKNVKYADLLKWVEISMFGPFFTKVGQGDVLIYFQLSAYCVIKNQENLYTITDLVDQVVKAASTPIKLEGTEHCLRNPGLQVRPRGRVLHPESDLVSVVIADYEFHLQE